MTLVGQGFFARVNQTGLIMNRPFFLRTHVLDEYVQLVDTGEEYILAWSPDDAEGRGTLATHIQRVSRMGDLLGTPVLLNVAGFPARFGWIAWADGALTATLRAVDPGPVAPYIQRFDAVLTPLGPAVPLETSAVPADSNVSDARGP